MCQMTSAATNNARSTRARARTTGDTTTPWEEGGREGRREEIREARTAATKQKSKKHAGAGERESEDDNPARDAVNTPFPPFLPPLPPHPPAAPHPPLDRARARALVITRAQRLARRGRRAHHVLCPRAQAHPGRRAQTRVRRISCAHGQIARRPEARAAPLLLAGPARAREVARRGAPPEPVRGRRSAPAAPPRLARRNACGGYPCDCGAGERHTSCCAWWCAYNGDDAEPGESGGDGCMLTSMRSVPSPLPSLAPASPAPSHPPPYTAGCAAEEEPPARAGARPGSGAPARGDFLAAPRGVGVCRRARPPRRGAAAGTAGGGGGGGPSGGGGGAPSGGGGGAPKAGAPARAQRCGPAGAEGDCGRGQEVRVRRVGEREGRGHGRGGRLEAVDERFEGVDTLAERVVFGAGDVFLGSGRDGVSSEASRGPMVVIRNPICNLVFLVVMFRARLEALGPPGQARA
ncbi:hypothetical protein B0H10DRAFT_2385773 [Mycena sp. CBHHK59/15]|nr:hypothetical protein B0H10DRAFT_2385773 [Mycena sp. CBHHK59/15]